MKIENTPKISAIRLQCDIPIKYPITEKYYVNYVEVEILPEKLLPDYDDFISFVKGLSYEQMVVEDVVEKVFNYFNELNPIHLRVISNITMLNMPISVTKEK